METFTIHENDKEVKLAIRTLLPEDTEEADRVYASKISSLLTRKGKDKLIMREQVNAILRDRGIWTEEDDKKTKQLQKEISDLLNKLRKGGGHLVKDGRNTCIKITDKRKELVDLTFKRRIYDDSTVESFAESEKLDYFIYAATVYAEDGRQYWSSFEDMKRDKSNEVYQEANKYVMKSIFGIDVEFEKNLPENKWLLKKGFIDQDLRYVDRKTGEYVDRSGNPISQIEKEVVQQLENLQGDIVEEEPFLDDETNEPVPIN